MDMILKSDFLPSFRDSDENGLISLKGYLNYFLDACTVLMNGIDRGNDSLYEQYGLNCIYTKYVVHVESEVDISKNIQSETWLEKPKSRILTYFSTDFKKNDIITASARAEVCAFDRNNLKIDKIERIDFPEGFMEERKPKTEPVTKFKEIPQSDKTYIYSHRIRYTDLDSNKHMTNLRYVDLVINTFDSDFYKKHMITDFEIHFVNQCFEDEEVTVYRDCIDNVEGGYFISIYKENGELAVKTKIKVSDR